MKGALWTCVIFSLVNAFMFPDFITLAYIAILLFIIYMHGKDEIKTVKILMIIVAILGGTLAVINLNFISIITSVILIMAVLNDYLKIKSQKKYDESLGINSLFPRQKGVERNVSSKYDTEALKAAFYSFVYDYDTSNQMVKQKYNHSLRVANNAMYIANRVGLDKEGKYLAYLMGLIHDVGRFEQVKINNSLDDNELLDHGSYGEDLLRSGLLRKFIQEEKYDSLIYKVVRNHNKQNIEDNLSEDEKLYTFIIRDADKLDILENLSKGEFEDFYNVTKDMDFSQTVLNEINNKRTIDYNMVNNSLDLVLLRLALVYDINYSCTLSVVRQNDYLNKYINLLDVSEKNKEILENIVRKIYQDIDNEIK